MHKTQGQSCFIRRYALYKTPGYHADFHEGHGTVGAWQGNGMAPAWARHAMFVSFLTPAVSYSASSSDRK